MRTNTRRGRTLDESLKRVDELGSVRLPYRRYNLSRCAVSSDLIQRERREAAKESRLKTERVRLGGFLPGGVT